MCKCETESDPKIGACNYLMFFIIDFIEFAESTLSVT